MFNVVSYAYYYYSIFFILIIIIIIIPYQMGMEMQDHCSSHLKAVNWSRDQEQQRVCAHDKLNSSIQSRKPIDMVTSLLLPWRVAATFVRRISYIVSLEYIVCLECLLQL